MNREKIIDDYHKVFFNNPVQARQLIKKLDYKSDHQLLHLIAETYFSEAKFNANGEEKKLDTKKLRCAETYIIKAFEIRLICTNVLWTLGKVKKDYGQANSAIFCYREIIRLGVKGILRDPCKNDISVALAQINDSKFELYRLYHTDKPSLSKRYLTLYKQGLKKGIFTLFKPLNQFLEAEKHLEKLT